MQEFLKHRPGKGGASSWCCHVLDPELLAQIEGIVNPLLDTDPPQTPPWSGIVAWLREQGVKTTASKVSYHWERGHHAR